MFVFFTIPWIFVVMIVLMVLGVGVSVLRFVLDHIIIISAILWLPVAWLVWEMWKDKSVPDEEKVENTLLPLSAIPAYVSLIRLMEKLLDTLGKDLFAFIVYIPFAPMIFIMILLAGVGMAYALSWLHKKIIKSGFVTIFLGVLIVVPMVWYFWNLNW